MATSDIPAGPPPPPRRTGSASNPPPEETAQAESAPEPSITVDDKAALPEPGLADVGGPDSDALPTIVRSEPPSLSMMSLAGQVEPGEEKGKVSSPPPAAGTPALASASSSAPDALPELHPPASPAAVSPLPIAHDVPARHPPASAADAMAPPTPAPNASQQSQPPPGSSALPVIHPPAPAGSALPVIHPPAPAASALPALHPPPPAPSALPAIHPPAPGPSALPALHPPPPAPSALPALHAPPPAASGAPPTSKSTSTPPPARAASAPPVSDDEQDSATFVQRPNASKDTWAARSGDGLGAIGRDAQKTWDQAVEYLDTHDAWVPIRFRGRIRGSVLTLAGALTALALLGGVVALAKLSSARPRSTEVAAAASGIEDRAAPAVFAASPAPPAASRDDVGKGIAEASDRPASTMPSSGKELDEGALLLDSARSFTWQGRDAEAVTLVERALLRNPELRSDARVRDVLLRTAHADDRGSAAATFALLEGPMLEAGAELMYEISIARVGKDSARKRAQNFLNSKQFAKNAALPLFLAVKLRQAKSCEDKHALLTLAAGGGKQTLDYLRELQAHTTCAPDDLVNCYPCLRADSRLNEAIAAIEKRIKG